MASFKEALEEFGRALGKLKYMYADEYSCNPHYLSVHVDTDDNVTIIPENETGDYLNFFREWVDIDA